MFYSSILLVLLLCFINTNAQTASLSSSRSTTNTQSWQLKTFCIHFGTNNSIYGPWDVTLSGTFNLTGPTSYLQRQAYTLNSAFGIRTQQNGVGTITQQEFTLAPVRTDLADNRVFTTAPYLSSWGISFLLPESTVFPNGYLFAHSSLYIGNNNNFVELYNLPVEYFTFRMEDINSTVSPQTMMSCPSTDRRNTTTTFRSRAWLFCHVEVGYYESSIPSYSTMIGELYTAATLYRNSPFDSTILLPQLAYLVIGVRGVRTFYSELQESSESPMLGLGCTTNGLLGDCLLYIAPPYVTNVSSIYRNQGIAFNFPDPVMSSYGQIYNYVYLYHNTTTGQTQEYPSGKFQVVYGKLNIKPAQPNLAAETLCTYPNIQGLPTNGTGNGLDDNSATRNSITKFTFWLSVLTIALFIFVN